MSAREFVLVDGGSSKFWKIEVIGATHTVTYGRIGTDGRSTTKSFDSHDAAELAASKLIASKVKKGYSETAAKKATTKKATAKEATAKSKPKLKDMRRQQAQAALPSTPEARAKLIGNLQQWVATKVEIDLDRVDFQFVPDLESENWFESAVLKGQKFGPALNVGTVFGGCLATHHSLEQGDIICDQYAGGIRRRVLWVHDEAFFFAEGGDPDVDPDVASEFAADWVERAEALSEAVQLLPKQGRVTKKMLAEIEAEAAGLLGDFMADRRERVASLRRVPEGNWAMTAINAVLARIDPEPESKPSTRGIPAALMSASWIVRSLCVGPSIPSEADANAWRSEVDAAIASGRHFSWGPLMVLRSLWSAYFLAHKLDELLSVASKQSWRVIQDAARLVARLREDPRLGSIELVTSEGEAVRQAERARAIQAANDKRQQGQERIEAAGGVVLKMLGAPPQLTRFDIPRGADLPEFVQRHNTQWQHEHPWRQHGIGSGWAARTASGRWFALKRVKSATQPRGYGTSYDYRLLTGHDELAAVETVPLGNNHWANPNGWFLRGETVYTTERGMEINLESGSIRSFRESMPAELEGVKIYRPRFFVTDTGIGCLEDINHKRHLTVYRVEPGGEATLEARVRLDVLDAQYDCATGLILIANRELGVLLARHDRAGLRVVHRVRANFSKPAGITLAAGLGGVYLGDDLINYEFANLDRIDGEGVPLAAVSEQPELLDKLSGPLLELER